MFSYCSIVAVGMIASVIGIAYCGPAILLIASHSEGNRWPRTASSRRRWSNPWLSRSGDRSDSGSIERITSGAFLSMPWRHAIAAAESSVHRSCHSVRPRYVACSGFSSRKQSKQHVAEPLQSLGRVELRGISDLLQPLPQLGPPWPGIIGRHARTSDGLNQQQDRQSGLVPHGSVLPSVFASGWFPCRFSIHRDSWWRPGWPGVKLPLVLLGSMKAIKVGDLY